MAGGDRFGQEDVVLLGDRALSTAAENLHVYLPGGVFLDVDVDVQFTSERVLDGCARGEGAQHIHLGTVCLRIGFDCAQAERRSWVLCLASIPA